MGQPPCASYQLPATSHQHQMVARAPCLLFLLGYSSLYRASGTGMAHTMCRLSRAHVQHLSGGTPVHIALHFVWPLTFQERCSVQQLAMQRFFFLSECSASDAAACQTSGFLRTWM